MFANRNVSQQQKKEIIKEISQGKINIVVGTHAIIQNIQFYNLGLVITDEQHRFGLIKGLY